MRNPVGRPYNPNALKRTGKRYDFLLSKEDESKLAALAKTKSLSRSELLRMIIRILFEKQEI